MVRSAITIGLALLWTGQTARASLILTGGTYTVTGVNFVTNFSQAVTVSGATQPINSGQLNLKLTVVPDGPNAEWDVFSFSTPGGGPLAGNLNASWRLDLTGLPFSQSVAIDGGFFQWTVNGVAVSPIVPFGGGALGVVNPNPTSLVPGPVYGGTVGPPGQQGTTINLPNLVVLNPYSFISNGGINPNTANGFNVGLHFTAVNPTAVPTPSSIALLGLGSAGLLGATWRGRKRPADAMS